MCKFCDNPIDVKIGLNQWEDGKYALAKDDTGEFCILADNSGEEYAPVKIPVCYCPVCGEKLH